MYPPKMKRFEHKNNMSKTLKIKDQFPCQTGSKCLDCAITITVTMYNKLNMSTTKKNDKKKLCLTNSMLSYQS